jgi:branched-chain amino acid transport system substrate-binding protein
MSAGTPGAGTTSRRLGLVLACVALLAGCGTSGTILGGNDTYSATTLTVYSDLPLLGPDGAQMNDIVDGEVLALYDHGGHVGKLHVSLESLNDYADGSVSDPLLPDPLRSPTLQIGRSAQAASSDLSTVAYIGDYDSDASWISLPLNNQNDILQISPGSPYVGFTDANPADLTGDPGAFYPYGSQTFARLVPSDAVEARAIVSWMHALGVRRLALVEDSAAAEAHYGAASNSNLPYDAVIARLVAADAPAAAITIVGDHGGVDTAALTRPADYAGLAGSLAGEHADAVLLGGVPNGGAQALWRELHSALPQAKLFAPSTLASAAFLPGLGPAAGVTYVTSPILEPSQYPLAAQRVLAQFRRRFGRAASVFALYGYDAMNDVLLAIRRAGRLAAKRPTLLHDFFALGRAGFHGVLGNYTIDAQGDTSLTAFDGYRVSSSGQLVLARGLS